MKRLPAWLAALCLLPAVSAHAQLAAGRPVQQVTLTGAAERQVAEIRLELGPSGDWQTVTNAYTELADGLNYWDEGKGEWAESRAELELADGGAVGRHAHQRAWFSPNANDHEGAARLWTADGRRFRTSVLALSYRDAATGREALLATLRDTEGELVQPNQVIYRDAFEGLQADVVYTFRTTGVEQDVILRESPPDPEDFGLLAETTRLQALTEVMEAPEPVKDRRLIAAVEDPAVRALMAEPDWVDERLSFGSFRLAQGRAFSLGERAPGEADNIPVAKTWSAEPDGRVLLVEAVEYVALTPALGRLPVQPGAVRRQRAALAPGRTPEPRLAAVQAAAGQAVKAGRSVPLRKFAAAAPKAAVKTLMLAQAPVHDRPGFVLDWQSVSGSLSDHVFRGDETYLVSGNVTCTGANTVFEAGTVLKYASNVTLTVQTPLDWQGALYRPVVLTARDDWTVGQGITTSNALSGLYATKALVLDAGTNRTFTVKHLRVAHAQRAIEIVGRSGHILSHVQLVNCADGVRADGADFSLRNTLFHNVATNLLQGAAATARLEHVTVNTATKFNHNVGAVYVTNSVLAGVTTPGTYTANAVSVHASAAGVFQAVGAGYNYLAAGSTNRNAGTTAVNPDLLAELRDMTTVAPLPVTDHFTSHTVLAPAAPRDVGAPDRGYHYPPLDYYWSALNLTNATLRLTNGAVVGLYGTTGLTLRRGAKLHSDGTAGALNRFVRYHTVQEQSNWGGGPASTAFTMFSVNSGGSPYPELRCTFTDFSTLAVTTNTTTSRIFLNGGLAVLALSHCQIRGPALSYSGFDSFGPVLAFTNNLWEGALLELSQYTAYYPYTVHAYNNLFRRGRVALDSQRTDGPWTLKDNLFDANSITVGGAYFTASHNGFRSGLSPFGLNYKTGLALDYAAGPLGSHYYALTGGTTNLVNAGSRNATNAGLYHFTVRTDQARETNSVVDIGFHYVAGPSAGARFVGTDPATKGSWQGVHGLSGYGVIQNATNYPAGVTVTPSGNSSHVWAASTADVRGLEKPGGGRIAACWFSGSQFDVALAPPDGRVRRVALYCLDWDASGRKEVISVRDTTLGTTLDSRNAEGFSSGVYYVWDVVGNVTLRVANNGPVNGVLSGLFFSPGAFFPLDSDGDGFGDYQEDFDGDGVVEAGEGLGPGAFGVTITRPQGGAYLP